ncbi:hypothetical protein Hanom_Chr11g01001311 [Helianthus anomalus]
MSVVIVLNLRNFGDNEYTIKVEMVEEVGGWLEWENRWWCWWGGEEGGGGGGVVYAYKEVVQLKFLLYFFYCLI